MDGTLCGTKSGVFLVDLFFYSVGIVGEVPLNTLLPPGCPPWNRTARRPKLQLSEWHVHD